jgi:predicted dehydrogenase
VDDDATVIVTYPKAEGIIQASWNWPYDIKDIEIYGETGSVQADDYSLLLRKPRKRQEPSKSEPLTKVDATSR